MASTYVWVDRWSNWVTPVRKLVRHVAHLHCGRSVTYTEWECEGGGPLMEQRLPCPKGCHDRQEMLP